MLYHAASVHMLVLLYLMHCFLIISSAMVKPYISLSYQIEARKGTLCCHGHFIADDNFIMYYFASYSLAALR